MLYASPKLPIYAIYIATYPKRPKLTITCNLPQKANFCLLMGPTPKGLKYTINVIPDRIMIKMSTQKKAHDGEVNPP